MNSKMARRARAQTARTLDDCVRDIALWAGAARKARNDVIVLCHGGPIAEPAEALYVLDRAPTIDGLYGALSLERLPVEVALSARTREFVELRRSGVVVGETPGISSDGARVAELGSSSC